MVRGDQSLTNRDAVQPQSPAGLAGISPTSQTYAGAGYANAAGLGSISTPDGSLTALGNAGYAAPGADGAQVTTPAAATSLTAAAEAAGLSNPIAATGVASAAAEAAGIGDVPSFVSKIANDPAYAPVKAALDSPSPSPTAIASALTEAMGNDPSVVGALVSGNTGLGSVSELASRIAAHISTAAAAPSGQASTSMSDVPGGLVSLGGLTGSPEAATGTPSFTFNGNNYGDDASTPSSYGPDTSLPATSPSLTVRGPGGLAGTPAATPQTKQTPGEKVGSTVIDAGLGAIPIAGPLYTIARKIGLIPSAGDEISKHISPGSPGQVVGNGNSRNGSLDLLMQSLGLPPLSASALGLTGQKPQAVPSKSKAKSPFDDAMLAYNTALANLPGPG